MRFERGTAVSDSDAVRCRCSKECVGVAGRRRDDAVRLARRVLAGREGRSGGRSELKLMQARVAARRSMPRPDHC